MSVHTLNMGEPKDTTPAPEGHDAKMASAFDASQQTPTPETTDAPKPERPAHIPEKFWKDGQVDVEGLARSYAELEKVRSKAPETAGEKPATPEGVPPEAAGEASVEDAQSALQSVGLDYNAISERFQQTGELATEDRAALNKAGIPDAMIDAYIDGQRARADAYVSSIKETVGGAEEYAKITTWAAQGLSKSEIAAFNKVIEGNDPEAAKLAVAGLKQRYESALGAEPKLVQSQTGPAAGGDVFRSNAELVKAMQDPRYRSDPAYRNDVIQKLNRSSIL